jgi:hypothetical protein
MDRYAWFDPDVRQPRAGPRRRDVFAEQVFRPVRLVDDNRRSDVAITQLRADHLVRLALLDVGHRGEPVARRLPLRRGLTDIREVLRSPFAAPQRRVA